MLWPLPVLLCVAVVSALGLRRWHLIALAVLLVGSLGVILGGSVASRVPRSTSMIAVLIVVICAVGLEICYLAATRTRKVSLAGVAMVGVSLLAGLLAVPPLTPSSFDSVSSGVEQSELLAGVAAALVTIIGWLIGYSVRQAHAQTELVRAQAAAQTALAERLRIARARDAELSIEVTDSGRGGDPSGTGYGITGMRERAALLGGDLSAEPRPGAGFRVAARLPVPAAAR